MIPNYLTWNIVRQPVYLYQPDIYTRNSSEFVYRISTKGYENLEKNSFVILALCFQILPILILFIFTILLFSNSSQQCQSNELPTIKMVLSIVCSTISLELPRVLFFLASGVDTYFLNLYSHLGDLWDLTSISTSFIIFPTYFLLSQQFRFEISKLFSRFPVHFNLTTTTQSV